MGQVLVDQGALKMALNVLRRAGKDEVADELEKSAVTPEVRACAHDPKPTGMYEPFDTACGKCGDFWGRMSKACKAHPDAPHGLTDPQATASEDMFVSAKDGSRLTPS
jgi:hypothetical protein